MMNSTGSDFDYLLNFNQILLVVQWLGLIFIPLTQLSQSLLLLSILHVFTSSLSKSVFHVLDCWISYWMVNDFYNKYTSSFRTIRQFIFTTILSITYCKSLLGLLIYFLAKMTDLKKYEKEFNNIHIIANDILYGFIGLLILFFIALPAYMILIIYCYLLDGSTQRIEQIRLNSIRTPIRQRTFIWSMKFYLLQLVTFIQYIEHASNPYELFRSLENVCQNSLDRSCYVFGNGIGVNSHELVKRYLQDIPPLKSCQSLGWQVSLSQERFCHFTSVFLSSHEHDLKLSREISANQTLSITYCSKKIGFQNLRNPRCIKLLVKLCFSSQLVVN